MRSKSENIISLNTLVWPYKEKRESGLLSVKVEGYEHLVKIYLELGMVVGLSMGKMKNESCLDVLPQCKPLSAIFINNYRATDSAVANKEEAARLDEILTLYPGTGATIVGEKASIVSVSAENILKLENDYIDILGPLGKMLIDIFYADSGYKRGQDMPVPLYSQLIEQLKEELPSQYQLSFAAKYASNQAQ